MAFTFNTTPFHGKVCRIEKNGTNLEYNVDWNLNVALDMAEGRRMGQQWDEKYPGCTEWNGGFKGSFAPGNTEQKAFFDNIITTTPGTKLTDVHFVLDDPTNYFEGDLYLNKLAISISVDNVVNFAINFKGTEGSTLISCDTITNVSYDGDNPETIAQNDNDIEITISDGIGPFTWAVSGTGFSFDDETTAGRSNILSASGSACGLATITITDACNDEATGSVRCTTGTWTEKERGYACGFGGTCAFYQPSLGQNCAIDKEIISGYQKWEFPRLYGTCAWSNNGCTINATDWDLSPGGGACNNPVTYPPTCGSPDACAEDNTCDPFWGELNVGCVYRRYNYYEWECA